MRSRQIFPDTTTGDTSWGTHAQFLLSTTGHLLCTLPTCRGYTRPLSHAVNSTGLQENPLNQQTLGGKPTKTHPTLGAPIWDGNHIWERPPTSMMRTVQREHSPEKNTLVRTLNHNPPTRGARSKQKTLFCETPHTIERCPPISQYRGPVGTPTFSADPATNVLAKAQPARPSSGETFSRDSAGAT